jgi:ankyrin repeat protein
MENYDRLSLIILYYCNNINNTARLIRISKLWKEILLFDSDILWKSIYKKNEKIVYDICTNDSVLLFKCILNSKINWSNSTHYRHDGTIGGYSDKYSSTPIHIIIQKKNIEMIKLFIMEEDYSSILRDIFYQCVHDCDENIMILLLSEYKDETYKFFEECIKKKWNKVIDILIKKSKNLNGNNNNIYKFTPLYYAILYDDIETTKKLVNAGADVNINICDVYADGSTSLHNAVLRNNMEIVKILLDAGAEKYSTNKHGKTPFYYIKKKNIKMQNLFTKIK